MAFTTWANLRAQMENDMADMSWRRKRYESPGDGVVMEYTSFSEFRDAYDYVCMKAEMESGICAGRTVARSGGRF